MGRIPVAVLCRVQPGREGVLVSIGCSRVGPGVAQVGCRLMVTSEPGATRLMSAWVGCATIVDGEWG